MNPTFNRQMERQLRCEGTGAQSRGCFNWVQLGKLSEQEFRAKFGAILCIPCYAYGWTRNDKPMRILRPMSTRRTTQGSRR